VNFLNIGPAELMVILLIAILLVGPRRMAEIVRSIGRLSRQMRKLSGEFVGAIRNEIQATEDGVQRVVDEAKGTVDGGQGIPDELAETKKEADKSLKSIVEGDLGLSSITEDIRAVQREAQGMMQDMLGEVMAAADMRSEPNSQAAIKQDTTSAEQVTSQTIAKDAVAPTQSQPAPAEELSEPPRVETVTPADEPPSEGLVVQTPSAEVETADDDIVAAAPKQEESAEGETDTEPEHTEISAETTASVSVTEEIQVHEQAVEDPGPEEAKPAEDIVAVIPTPQNVPPEDNTVVALAVDTSYTSDNESGENENREPEKAGREKCKMSPPAESAEDIDKPARGKVEPLAAADENLPEVDES